MFDHTIGGEAAARSHSANRLLQAMNKIMAPLFLHRTDLPINADHPMAACGGPIARWS